LRSPTLPARATGPPIQGRIALGRPPQRAKSPMRWF